jgi:hypothetical protein
MSSRLLLPACVLLLASCANVHDRPHQPAKTALQTRLGHEPAPYAEEVLTELDGFQRGNDPLDLDPRRLIAAAGMLIRLPKTNACMVLHDLAVASAYPVANARRDPRFDWFVPLLLARLLFVSDAGDDVELPALLPWPWLNRVTHISCQSGCPLFPLVLQDGCPFVVWHPGNGGVLGDVTAYIEYCRNYTRMRHRLPPAATNPADAAEDAIARIDKALEKPGMDDLDGEAFHRAIHRQARSLAPR